MLTTRAKIALAAALQQTLTMVPRIAGLETEVVATRGGIRWALDLNEGIDFSIWLLGAFERRSVAAYRRLVRPGMTVVDIGANVGAHTLHFANLVGNNGRVIAVEPTAWAIARLRKNLELNEQITARVDVNQVMLVGAADEALPAEIYASWPLNGRGVHPKLRAQAKSTAGAQTLTLNQLAKIKAANRIDFVKLDVDGHEGTVLRGAIEVLQRDHPTIIFELSPYILAEAGDSATDLLRLLHDLNYRLYDLNLRRTLPGNAREIADAIPDGGGINVIAKPMT